jgi:hypothetical protein
VVLIPDLHLRRLTSLSVCHNDLEVRLCFVVGYLCFDLRILDRGACEEVSCCGPWAPRLSLKLSLLFAGGSESLLFSLTRPPGEGILTVVVYLCNKRGERSESWSKIEFSNFHNLAITSEWRNKAT